jgi:hydroxyethylthiazole kinase-like sugar kinase family protein
MLAAGRHANQNGKPVVFDPVGVGATAFRRATAASECHHICCAVKKPLSLMGMSIQNYWMRGSRQ